MTPEPIAIVGLGGVLPGAATLDDFWSVVERGIDTASEPPAERWLLDLDLAYHADPARADRVYSRRACFVRDFRLDPTGLDLPSDLLDALDPMVHLALHAGRQAWQDTVTEPVDPGRVGVMLGNIVLPTGSASAMADWILGRRFERELFRTAGVPMPPETRSPVSALNRWVASLPATMLSKALGLGGERLCLDAACASSLFAVDLAIDALRSGRLDAVLAGGLSRPDSLYTQMGFSQLLAVSPNGRCSPFDHKSDGLVVGEGAGVLVLKRLTDALAHGDRIRALVHGVGLSNDVEGSLLAPSREGQLRAMAGAYRTAGWRPGDVDLVECHATGTPVGDAVEFASLQKLWEDEDASPGSCVIGSVKSNTGHLLTGAGAVGLLKTVLALEHGVLPPTANFEQPGDKIDMTDSPFRVLREAEPWPSPSGHPRRAAVSGFGFGGTNAHVLIEEAVEPSRRAVSVTVAERLPAPDVAIVGLGARVGPWRDLSAVRERLFGRGEAHAAKPKRNHWGVPDAPLGWFIEELEIPFGRFKIPPKEIEEALAQQMLMLQVADSAIADACLDDVERLRTGVFVGVELDLNTTNYHLRWSVRARAADWGRRMGRPAEGEPFERWVDSLCDAITPALNANRTIGGLGSIVASRVAREFGLGGSSYVLSNEEASGLSALRAATRALQRGRLDCALVGAVDLSGDVRSLLSLSATDGISAEGVPRPFEAAADGVVPSDGAVALVLKREQDARRDGDRIYAIVRGFGSAAGDLEQACERAIQSGCEDAGVSPRDLAYVESHGSGVGRQDRAEAAALNRAFEADTVLGCSKAHVGHTGAAAGLVSVLGATLSLYHQMLPPAESSGQGSGGPGLTRLPEPHPWLRDRVDGPRRVGVLALARSGACTHVVLEESDHGARRDDTAQPLGPTPEGLFVVEADDADGLTDGLRRLSVFASGATERPAAHLAESWWQERPLRPEAPLAVTLVVRDASELESLAGTAADQMERGEDPSDRRAGRIFFSKEPLGHRGDLAFVYPGSGSQFKGMGREACLQWPRIVQEQDRTNDRLLSQLVADTIWRGDASATDARTVILSQVALGTIATDLMTGFGVRPDAVVGYSLGETAGLFSLGAWHERDEMLRRTTESDLFVSSLTGECTAARRAWGLDEGAELNWLVGVVDRPAEHVREALEGRERVYLLIVNTPDECVIGGDAAAVEAAVEALDSSFHALRGVTTVHCEVAREVEQEYRDLHLLDTRAPEGVRFYSGAWGEAYEVDRERAADSLLAQAIHGVDFPKTVQAAYEDGVRIFLEMGPGSSCTRMIHKILDGREFRARSISSPTQDEPSTVLRALAMLIAERVPVDVGPLYEGMPATEEESGPVIRVPVGQEGFGSLSDLVSAEPTTTHVVEPAALAPTGGEAPDPIAGLGHLAPPPEAPDFGVGPLTASPDLTGLPAELAAALRTSETTIKAHEAYLKAAQRTQELAALQVAHQQELIRAMTQGGTASVPVVLDRDQLMEFAVGSIGKVLGAAFADVDSHATRVRLPDEPLMLVDRVTAIEGEPQSMTSGRIVTEHDVLEGAWYLDGGRMPTCIAVEAGQADLLLSGYLGIDSETKGLAVYRLLDAVVTFHGELPRPGQTVVYDIRILRFFRQGDTWLFHFQFDATVDGRPMMTMREGSAGFFTQDDLDAGQGIVQSTMEQRPQPGTRPTDWRELVPMRKESYDAERLEALRAGDLAKAFGEEFAGLAVERPLTIPGDRMRLVHRVIELDPDGGRYGMGSIVAEADIHPDDWFITCHFVDDEVMPGTLMYECCMHTLRVFLLRMGWVAEEDTATWQPILEVKSRLRCRGQVLASTRVVTYEINIRELGYGPEPYAIVDALMYADGKPVVDIRDMSVRLTGATREGLEAMWASREAGAGALTETTGGEGPTAAATGTPTVPYDKASILAFSGGKPSAAFGDPYRIFDEGTRRIARLPRPPYQFLDRVTAVEGEPFVMKSGARARAQFDVSPEHWYFASNRQREMPFAVLLEVALQPCGWLAAYVGSALTSNVNLRFRNLGGDAVQLARMMAGPDVITTDVELTGVSTSGGMIIQHYHMALESERVGRLYEGTTYFGFFSEQALADQVGMRDAVIHQPSPAELERGTSFPVPLDRPFADSQMRMVDRVELLVPDGGPEGLGWIHGSIGVDAEAWFFEAHFYQDPVWPGSLGLEAFLQLLKVYAARRWELGEEAQFDSMPAEHNHRWSYRGQIIQGCERVEVFASITAVDDERRSLVADGFLVVDGRTIYSMNDFSLAARA